MGILRYAQAHWEGDLKTGKGQRTLAKPLPAGTLIFDDLAAIADQLLL